MAEGSVEEDSGDMLGPTAAPILQPPAPSNLSVKDEVSPILAKTENQRPNVECLSNKL